MRRAALDPSGPAADTSSSRASRRSARAAQATKITIVAVSVAAFVVVGLGLLVLRMAGVRLFPLKARGYVPLAMVPPRMTALASRCLSSTESVAPSSSSSSTLVASAMARLAAASASAATASPGALRTVQSMGYSGSGPLSGGRGFFRRTELPGLDGLVMALHPYGELVSDSILHVRRPFCPPGMLTHLRERARLGDFITLLDVGANIGSCSLAALALGHSAIAVEPNPANLELILISVALSELPERARLVVVPLAVGEASSSSSAAAPSTTTTTTTTRAKAAPVTMLAVGGNMGASVIIPNDLTPEQRLTAAKRAGMHLVGATEGSSGNGGGGGGGNNLWAVKTSTVCVETLDEAVRLAYDDAVDAAAVAEDDALHGVASTTGSQTRNPLPPIGAIKMDVQGHEAAALLGGATVLARGAFPTLRRVDMEVWPPVIRAKGFNPDVIFDALNGNGFDVVEAGAGQYVEGWAPPKPADLNAKPGWSRGTGEDAGPALVLDVAWERGG
jgi:FkbM family methyltransferase